MQLPGMSTDPVRVRLEVTWWPEENDFSLSRSVWTRPDRQDAWQMEGLEVSGSPIRPDGLAERWTHANVAVLDFMWRLQEDHRMSGPFR